MVLDQAWRTRAGKEGGVSLEIRKAKRRPNRPPKNQTEFTDILSFFLLTNVNMASDVLANERTKR